MTDLNENTSKRTLPVGGLRWKVALFGAYVLGIALIAAGTYWVLDAVLTAETEVVRQPVVGEEEFTSLPTGETRPTDGNEDQ
jgi:hypothetical protein